MDGRLFAGCGGGKTNPPKAGIALIRSKTLTFDVYFHRFACPSVYGGASDPNDVPSDISRLHFAVFRWNRAICRKQSAEPRSRSAEPRLQSAVCQFPGHQFPVCRLLVWRPSICRQSAVRSSQSPVPVSSLPSPVSRLAVPRPSPCLEALRLQSAVPQRFSCLPSTCLGASSLLDWGSADCRPATWGLRSAVCEGR